MTGVGVAVQVPIPLLICVNTIVLEHLARQTVWAIRYFRHLQKLAPLLH